MKDQIQALEKQRFNHLINKEYEQFAAMCAQDLHYVHSSGTIDDLSSYMSKLTSGYYDYQEMSLDIASVMDMQDCVLVIGDFYATVRVEGELLTLQNRALSIWKKERDDFKFLLYQGTPFSA